MRILGLRILVSLRIKATSREDTSWVRAIDQRASDANESWHLRQVLANEGKHLAYRRVDLANDAGMSLHSYVYGTVS